MSSHPLVAGRPRLLGPIAVVLSFAAGATDAFAFLLLGGVFTANMTGNLVLAGLTSRPGYPAMILGIVVAVVAFAAGLYGSFRVARPDGRPSRLVAVLGIGILAQVAVLVGWMLAPAGSGMAVQAPLIALSAIAMATQTAVARRLEKGSGVSTTYVTGTITNLMGDLADRTKQELGIRLGVIFALVGGALCGSLVIGIATGLGAALPVVAGLAGLALLLASLRSSARHIQAS